MPDYKFIQDKETQLFGLLENQKNVIPCTHETRLGVIEEFIHWQNVNNKSQKRFLDYTLSENEIREVVKRLLKLIK